MSRLDAVTYAADEADQRTQGDRGKVPNTPHIWHNHFLAALRERGYSVAPTNESDAVRRVYLSAIDLLNVNDTAENVHAEYDRGICELLCDVFGVENRAVMGLLIGLHSTRVDRLGWGQP